MKRAIVLVLDSLGIGNAPDAAAFGDAGADTLGHIARQRVADGRPLQLPHLARLGLYHAHHLSSGEWAAGITSPETVDGAWACAREISSGNDPTWCGSDHTREQVPILIAADGLAPGSHGRRESFADIGQTLAVHFGLSPMEYGRSLLKENPTNGDE